MKIFRRKYSDWTDEALMEALQKGDKHSFDELYKRYAGILKGYFEKMLWRDSLKAEDMLHDLFAKIIRNPGYFDTQKSFRTWVFSVAGNMCKNEYKKAEVRKNMTNGIDDKQQVIGPSNVFNQVYDLQFKEAFEHSLAQLDDKHKEVFVLRHFEGLSMKEIGEVMELNEGTVKSRLFYATKQLAEQLKVFNPSLTL